ncbi:hypothetical protein HZH66_012232 [Vespula vulgaris]|uniref:Uncharacterized protein n=2 Tax=Vespula TaxID=7451 RepID=A0A834KHM6_VESPE|nr:hypothetical protein HZH66_012232 [Vespula vulgaris]KAF7406926.1 hypothetical protein H0235_014582 [Vespula pensylvanica]
MQEGNHQYLTRGTAELLDNELLPSASSDSIHIVSCHSWIRNKQDRCETAVALLRSVACPGLPRTTTHRNGSSL